MMKEEFFLKNLKKMGTTATATGVSLSPYLVSGTPNGALSPFMNEGHPYNNCSSVRWWRSKEVCYQNQIKALLDQTQEEYEFSTTSSIGSKLWIPCNENIFLSVVGSVCHFSTRSNKIMLNLSRPVLKCIVSKNWNLVCNWEKNCCKFTFFLYFYLKIIDSFCMINFGVRKCVV